MPTVYAAPCGVATQYDGTNLDALLADMNTGGMATEIISNVDGVVTFKLGDEWNMPGAPTYVLNPGDWIYNYTGIVSAADFATKYVVND